MGRRGFVWRCDALDESLPRGHVGAARGGGRLGVRQPGGRGREEALVDGEADAGKVEPVGVPAGSHGPIVAHLTEGVPLERVQQKREAGVVECEGTGGVELGRELRSAKAVTWIGAVGLPARVVEQAEEEHELVVRALFLVGEVEPRRRDRVPVSLAVQSRLAAPAAGEDELDEREVGRGHELEG